MGLFREAALLLLTYSAFNPTLISPSEQDTLKSDMIHCNDVQVEENNLNIISILANFDIEDQYLRARVKGMRCFG